MTRLVTIKDQSQVPEEFKGLVTFQTLDGSVEAVIITVDGKELRIVVQGTYSTTLKVTVPEPDVDVKKYAVTGTFLGLTPVHEVFEEKYDADQKLSKYESAGGYDCGLEVKEVIVKQPATKL